MKSNRYVLFGILLLACLFISGCGTGMISGIIMDDDLKSVEGAIIYTDPPTSSVSTNPDGQYIIRNVPVGKYSVSAKKNGFAEASVDITVYTDQVAACDLQLSGKKKGF